MSSESAARSTFRKNVLATYPGTHWQRIEDSIAAGVPDICFCIPPDFEAWVEAKETDEWPKRPDTSVHIGLTKEQALWLREGRLAGRNTFVMVRFPDCWMFFDDHFERLVIGAPKYIIETWSISTTRTCDAARIVPKLVASRRNNT